jgi:hypothetical protein
MNKVKTILFILFMLLFLAGLVYRASTDLYNEDLLQSEGQITSGTLDKYSSIMGTNYVYFSFNVNNINYSGSESISKSRVKKWLIGTDDLEILYYPDDPSVHKLIDTRF